MFGIQKGKVLWISQRDGNGIILDEHKNEIYFDSSTFKDFDKIKRNDKVEFTLKCTQQLSVAYNK